MLAFYLVVSLLYPTGEVLELTMTKGLSQDECRSAVAYVVTQMEMTLSVAKIIDVQCVPNYSA